MPIKQFDLAKDRLRRAGVPDVAVLAEQLARGVIKSAAPREVIVVSESPAVSDFARSLAARVHESRAATLNEAVQGAYEALGHEYDRFLIVHGDLRIPDGLGSFDPGPGVTLVSDHRGDGTNILVVPTRVGFHFFYGPGSRRAHQAEAARLGLSCEVILHSPWSFDVDEPEDLLEGPDGI